MQQSFLVYKRIIPAGLWLLVTVSLGVWWFVHGLRQADTIAILQNQLGENAGYRIATLQKQYRMILMEGSVFLFLLTSGGATLVWLSYLDVKKSNLLKEFFSTVSHEMKTPLASLRLQAESLEEELGNSVHQKIVDRLINDTKRLELQMEKALYLASINRSESLYIEKIDLLQFLRNLSLHYPQLVIGEVPTDIMLAADKRALDSVIKNIIENAIIHGKASQILVRAIVGKNWMMHLVFTDNGNGFSGNNKKLGSPFFRHSTTSGSGIGIFLIKRLVTMMNGKVEYRFPEKGVEVQIAIPLWRTT